MYEIKNGKHENISLAVYIMVKVELWHPTTYNLENSN